MAGTEAKKREEIVREVNMIADYEIKECDVATVVGILQRKKSVRETEKKQVVKKQKEAYLADGQQSTYTHFVCTLL